MRVLCIDDSPGRLNTDYKLKYLGIYTVIEETIGKETGRRCYLLEECPDMGWFFADRFIPISEIDKTEEAKHRELKKIRESLGV